MHSSWQFTWSGVARQLVKPDELDPAAEEGVQPGERVLHDQELRRPRLLEVPHEDEPETVALLLRSDRLGVELTRCPGPVVPFRRGGLVMR